ncbi:hypothetical protein Xsze_04367 [Xenorhabdus szentirmaii DSM 16338]|nr:hypothetical protein Xsze_04367 [Xenorhabdus szentirmaii DSM 16338]
MDGFRLFTGFIDRQHQTAVEQLFIHINGGCGQHQHHRAFHRVAFGDEVPGCFVLARACHGQLAVTLQQLERIGRLPYPFFFGDSQYLMLQVGFTEVEQALAGHGAVLDALFFRYQVEHRLH